MMQDAISTYLKFVTYTQLETWSYSYLLEEVSRYKKDFQTIKIGNFLKSGKQSVSIDDEKFYDRVTVKINTNGVVKRDTEKGINIGTKKQFKAKAGQFIVSKIDARNGAFGIIPNELDGAIVTNDFPLFDVNTDIINPQFFFLITGTKEFINFAKSCSSGTTNRQRMDIAMFLNQKIPLPSLSEQESLVKNYFSKIEEAEKLNQQANNLESEIKEYLNEALGYKVNTSKASKLNNCLKVIDYTSLEQWGVEKNNANKLIHTNLYETKKVKELCVVSSGGTPSRNRKEYYNGNIPWIKTGEVLNNVICDTEEKITQEAIENSSAKIYPKESLIIAMYGQGLTRGRTAKLGIEASTNQACAVLFNIKNDLILTDFLWIYLMGEYHRLRELASGNNQPNLNAQMIKDYKVVVPPFEIQKQIIENFNNQKEKIKQLRVKVEQLKNQAEQEFETEIFSS